MRIRYIACSARWVGWIDPVEASAALYHTSGTVILPMWEDAKCERLALDGRQQQQKERASRLTEKV